MISNRKITIQGWTFDSVTQAALHFGISQQVAAKRLRQGWSIAEALGVEKRPLEKSLKSEFSNVSEEWHPTLNGPLLPSDVMPKSGQRVWWKCRIGHEWQASVGSRTLIGAGCPFCAGKRATKARNLEVMHPELAKQWHPTKNSPLFPKDVAPESGKKFWWICLRGHEWQASPNNRSKQPNCPQCVGKRVSPQNNLEVLNPVLAREWDFSANAGLLPSDVLSNSHQKVWWRCLKGHCWQASLSNRNQGRGCPYCGNKIVGEDNNLLKIWPEIAAQWLYAKNDELTPTDVTFGSKKRVWWKCSFGHEWQSSVSNRTSSQTGCPVCSPQTSKLELRIYTEIKSIFPNTARRQKHAGKECDVYIPELKLAIEIDGGYWHKDKFEKDKEKNLALAQIGIRVLRIREQGLQLIDSQDISFDPKDDTVKILHACFRQIALLPIPLDSVNGIERYLSAGVVREDQAFQTLIAATSNPLEGNSLTEKSPHIALEWQYAKNAPLTPDMVSNGSNHLVWWQCGNGHIWKSAVANRTSGHGCPYCSGRRVSPTGNLKAIDPALAAEWNYSKNAPLRPEDVRPGAGKVVWWTCSRGHDWESPIDRRSSGSGCPYCSGRTAHPDNAVSVLRPDLLSEWSVEKNVGIRPDEVMLNSSKKVWWKCLHGHEWQISPAARKNGSDCPYCVGRLAGYGNTFAAKCPTLLKEWDFEKNGDLRPDSITAGSGKNAHWICSEGHTWEAVIGTRSKGHRCPQCSLSRRKKNGNS